MRHYSPSSPPKTVSGISPDDLLGWAANLGATQDHRSVGLGSR
jgi:hypothetical protein